jgi:hypothetical protein
LYNNGTDLASNTSAAHDNEENVTPEHLVTCSVCTEANSATRTLTLACSHAYCHDCITDHFHSALNTDTALFPPRCCKDSIPIDDCRAFLSSDMLENTLTKQAEIDEAKATFCFRPSCGLLVCVENTASGVATCLECGTQTCTSCKGGNYEGLCPEDDDTKSFLSTANKVKGQRCSQCKNMVELETGCFHIR